MTDLLTSEKPALFFQRGMGAKPMFRGFHAFSGEIAKTDKSSTPVYYTDAGEIVKVVVTRGGPEPVTVSLDAPMQSIADLVGQSVDCPIHLAMVTDTCLDPDLKRSWGRWGSVEPQVILLIPDAQIEQRMLSNLIGREGTPVVPTGAIQVKFDQWALVRGGNTISLTEIYSGLDIVGIAPASSGGCADPECGGVTSCSVWYAAASNGTVWKSGDVWRQVWPSSTWDSNSGGIYADDTLVLVGGSDGVGAAYGVLRSIDGGETWEKIVFAVSVLVADTVIEIVRYKDAFITLGSSGIWRSTDDGRTWRKVQSGAMLGGAFDDTGLGIAITANRVYVSRSAGQTWKEVTAVGGSQRDVAFGGGYLHVADVVGGYYRSPTSTLRKGTTVVWESMDSVSGLTDIAFASAQLGYRLRSGSLERTLSGGYSWDAVSVSGTPPAFTQISLCGGRLGLAGGSYFGYYSPFFDSDPLYAAVGSNVVMIILDADTGLIFDATSVAGIMGA